MKPEWRACRSFFRRDGALRDLYIFGTDRGDWDELLASLAKSGHELTLWVDQEQRALTGRADEILRLGREASVLLRITAPFGHVHCHFFDEERIELDLLPTDISSARDFDQLLAFVQLLGAAVSKPVVLSQENWPENRLFTYLPDADEFVPGEWWIEEGS